MRRCFPDRWVRFHSLPGSKRYPDTERDYRTLLGRHHTLLNELSHGQTDLLILTTARDAHPRARRSGDVVAATSRAQHWWSFPAHDSEPDWPLWCSVFISRTSLVAAELDLLLRLVAEERVPEVLLIPPTFQWLYHPYDGGADVLLPDEAARDELRSQHVNWLSPLPSGL